MVNMFHAFVSSRGGRFGAAKLGIASFSVVAHATLITIAAVSSGRTFEVGFIHNPVPDERVTFIHPRDPEARVVTIRKGALARSAAKAALLVPDLTSLRAAIDATLASLPKVPDVDLDVTARATEAHDFGDAYDGQLA